MSFVKCVKKGVHMVLYQYCLLLMLVIRTSTSFVSCVITDGIGTTPSVHSSSHNFQSSSIHELPTSITDGNGTTPSVHSSSQNFQSSSIHELPTSITDGIGTTPSVHSSSHNFQSSSIHELPTSITDGNGTCLLYTSPSPRDS